MKIMKRNGAEADFQKEKIEVAVSKANDSVEESAKIDPLLIQLIAKDVEQEVLATPHTVSVEDIQDMVVRELFKYGATVVGIAYTEYRYKRMLVRRANTTDDKILSLIDLANEEAKQENANKNPVINSTQRDYIAGEVSRDITERILLPKEISDAHKQGIIHFHDSDYFIQRMFNCCVFNLEDMLQNGTVISETLIETPKSFRTACTIASQAVAQVASSQYGGQTYSLAHLAPFVDVSRQKIRRRLKEILPETMSDQQIEEIAEKQLLQEVKDGIQTMTYQLLTLLTTNGQTPFVSVFMYLDEVPEGQIRDDLALIIEETLKQRILGVKNEKGVYITPAFPKLLYVLDEDNVREGTKYWYLTKLAAKCTAKRMVPDYISAKIMKQDKGEVYGCMGCVDGSEVITYLANGHMYVESFERMWGRLSNYYGIKTQPNGRDLYMDTDGVLIYDHITDAFVENYRIIRNTSNKWMLIKFNNGRTLLCTEDHPFETQNRGMVFAKDLTENDVIPIDHKSVFGTGNQKRINFNIDRAWLLGFLMCDSTYYGSVTASIAATDEDDIEDAFKVIIKKEYGLDVKTIDQHRGVKGNYKDLRIISDETDTLANLRNYLISMFEGKAKKDRHIPNETFCWSRESRLAFLAGIIDADGYINDTRKMTKVQIGSTNKELAIQQMLLAQSLGMKAQIYLNYYKSNYKDLIRYRVEFFPCEELMQYIYCEKKKSTFWKY